MSLVRRNAEILLGTEFLTRLLLFFVVIQLANGLGDERYGELAYVFAIANLCVVLADFGLHTYTTRLLAQSEANWFKQRRSIVLLKIIGSILAWVLTLFIVSLTNHLSLVVIVAGALAIVATNGRMFSEAIARGQQAMHLEGYSKIIHAVIQGTALLTAIYLTNSLLTIAMVYAITSMMGWLVSVWLVRRPFMNTFTGEHTALTKLLPLVTPFALSIAINAQFNYFDSAVLGWFYPKAVVAWYTAAYKPIFFLTALAGLIITAFFPQIVTLWQNHNVVEVRKTIQRLLMITTSLGLVIALAGSWLAKPLIDLLYIPEYSPATLPFIILLWSTVCIFIWAPLGNSLQACGFEKAYTKNFIIAAIMNVPLTVWLIWQYSLIGAAIATAITNLSLVVLMAKDARRFLWKKTA